tara:strand:- start:544 stop:1002 length:459 start_codon:yes stop_codon:yes gene_type:complete
MKNNFFIFLFLIFFSCQKPSNKEENVLFNKDSDEIVFILELSTKENSVEDIEDFTQYLSDFIVKREPSTVYGYFISEDGKNVTLIERYNNSEDGIQHGKDFINGPNFEKFFQIFTIKSFITLGNATDEFKEFASENGFEIDYRESIGGYVRK